MDPAHEIVEVLTYCSSRKDRSLSPVRLVYAELLHSPQLRISSGSSAGCVSSMLYLVLEHTFPAHQLLENFYNGFPSCLIGYLNLRNKLTDSSFDSLLAVPKGDW